jgi:crotonobetainyl-CoA:carnitine CoA-transferase CaiB-like acyl-CoA transferase
MAALSGLRVLDLSTGIAGGYAGKLLADQGAAVVALERPGGDPLRQRLGSALDGGTGRPGLLFDWLATGKARETADLAAPGGRARFGDLVRTVDVVLEGPEAPFLDDDEEVAAALADAGPALTVVTMSPFGRTGPRRDQPATEFTLQAWCGSIAWRGPEGRPPLPAGGDEGLWVTGAFAACAAVAGWRQAVGTGRGGRFDVSIVEAMALTLVCFPSVLRSFLGTDDPGGRKLDMPSVVAAADGWIGLCIVTREQWDTLVCMVERPDLLGDEELATAEGRKRRADEVQALVEAWTGGRTVAEVLEQAARFRVPAAPLGSGRSVTEIDHFAARGIYQPDPAGRFVAPRSPVRIDGRSGVVRRDPPPARAAPPGTRPLAGVRIVDLTAFLAGPYATHLLCGLGADVVKVESVQRPDPLRYNAVVPPTEPQWYERSPYFHAVNLGKRSVTLDLRRPAGREALLRLVARADVVIENFTPRVLEQFDLGPDVLRAANPSVVVVRMPAFGLDGPWRDRGGFAQTMEQSAGLAWVTGHEDGPPFAPGGSCDIFAGVHGAFAVLAALADRDATGTGSLVEVPMVEVALNVAAEQVLEWTAGGVLLGRHGDRGVEAEPQGVHACQGPDAWVAVAVRSPAEWRGLCAVLGDLARPGWAGDPACTTVAGRRAIADDVASAIRTWCAGRDPGAAAAELLAAGVPAAPVLPGGWQDRDPQLRARGFFHAVDHPLVGRHNYPGWPMRASTVPGPWYAEPAPTLGQHTREVLRELGYDDGALARLAHDAVIGTTPVGAVGPPVAPPATSR